MVEPFWQMQLRVDERYGATGGDHFATGAQQRIRGERFEIGNHQLWREFCTEGAQCAEAGVDGWRVSRNHC